ncbi:hypothetical protein HY837_00880 [archaeon]|nr:hypothetical protein [archaeon]
MVESGRTIKSVCDYLIDFTGDGKVIPVAFSSTTGKKLHSVYERLPSWYGLGEYSGVTEKSIKSVKVNSNVIKLTRQIRGSLFSLAEVIADYLKLKRY